MRFPVANGTDAGGTRLSLAYRELYESLLRAVATTPDVEPDVLASFWPMVGHRYTGALMVIGRAVNGWIDQVAVRDLADPAACSAAAAAARRTSEDSGGCPMRWVTNAWGRPVGQYSTARSAFWRFVRSVLVATDPASRDDPLWSSRLVWSNLAKLAPWAGGNPGGALLEVQRELGPGLLAAEIDELRPRRVLVLTGRWWAEPYVDALGLGVDWRPGLVEGVGMQGERGWVIAPHPQRKPRELLSLVIDAYRALD